MDKRNFDYIDKNLAEIREKINNAAKSSEFDISPVMIAAVKYANGDEIKYLTENAGVTDIGENRVQQLLEHLDLIDTEKVNLHFIGSLQTNKVKYIIDKVCLIHSVDSLRLAAEIDKQAKKHGIIMDVLAEINSGREENKSGVLPEDAKQFCLELQKFDSINLRGFMTMAPKCENKSNYFKYFEETCKLVLDIWRILSHNNSEMILSMGMSESFEEAILSGATHVRIGRSIFKK